MYWIRCSKITLKNFIKLIRLDLIWDCYEIFWNCTADVIKHRMKRSRVMRVKSNQNSARDIDIDFPYLIFELYTLDVEILLCVFLAFRAADDMKHHPRFLCWRKVCFEIWISNAATAIRSRLVFYHSFSFIERNQKCWQLGRANNPWAIRWLGRHI